MGEKYELGHYEASVLRMYLAENAEHVTAWLRNEGHGSVVLNEIYEALGGEPE